MALLFLAARLVLAGVLAVAGAAKLADLRGSRQAIVDFGLPSALAPALGVALPLAELLLAALLVPVATAWWGAAGALALMTVFVGGIGYNLARGRRPECHCFGQLHSEPAGWPTLARNVALAALAALVVLREPPGTGMSAVAWLGRFTTTETVLLAVLAVTIVALAAQGWFLMHLFAQHGRVLGRLDALEVRAAQEPAASGHAAPTRSVPAPGLAPAAPAPPPLGLPVGAPAPAFAAATMAGGRGALRDLLAARKPVLLLFMDPHCGPCTALVPEAARWTREHADAFTLAIVSRGTPKENRKKLADAGAATVLLQQKDELSDRYQAWGTPSAVLVRPDGRIGSAVAAGADAIKALVERTTAARVDAAPSAGDGAVRPVGTLAPALKLPDLTGHPVELATFRGQDTLLLLWNPDCGFCQRLLPDIRAWEAAAAPGAPQLFIVSTGTAEANRALGLKSTIVLDATFAAGRAFGVGGTPSAVLVDAAGRVASGVAAGAAEVLALAAPVTAFRDDADAGVLAATG